MKPAYSDEWALKKYEVLLWVMIMWTDKIGSVLGLVTAIATASVQRDVVFPDCLVPSVAVTKAVKITLSHSHLCFTESA